MDDAAETPDKGGEASEGGVNGFTFDAGGLIALERRDRRVTAMVTEAMAAQWSIRLPATALAQVLRHPSRQVHLQMLLQYARAEVIPLDLDYAKAVGVLLAKTGTSDIADAHVVFCAQQADHAVVTSDPFDLQRLAPNLRIRIV
jgi:hypothetical protein